MRILISLPIQNLMSKITFREFRDKNLVPAYLADTDPNRALLGQRIIYDLLGFDEGIYEAVCHLSP